MDIDVGLVSPAIGPLPVGPHAEGPRRAASLCETGADPGGGKQPEDHQGGPDGACVHIPEAVADGVPRFTSPPAGGYVAPPMSRPDSAAGRTRLDLLDPMEVSKLGGLEIITEGVVEGFLSGLHRSPRRGFSVEFAEHRMYQAGDELRYVDWKILGRNDRLYVKQFEEETNLRAMVVFDVSRSMAWTGSPATVLPKIAYAQRLVAALALVLIRQRDATGLITFDEDVRSVLPPRARLSHWRQLVGALTGIQAGDGTAAEPALRRVVSQLHRRGLVVFVSDLLLDQALALKALRFLRHRGHQVLV